MEITIMIMSMRRKDSQAAKKRRIPRLSPDRQTL